MYLRLLPELDEDTPDRLVAALAGLGAQVVRPPERHPRGGWAVHLAPIPACSGEAMLVRLAGMGYRAVV